MLVSVVGLFLFISAVIGILFIPKTECKMNGIKIAIISIMAIFCYLSLCAGIYNKLSVDVGLSSSSFSLLLMNIYLWGFIIWKKKVQKLFFRLSDVMSLVIIIAFVVGISIHIFSTDLILQYRNVDAASHFSSAVNIVHTGKLEESIYFSAYIDALFIEFFAPMVPSILYYKAFIITDIVMHILEIGMFYCLALTISEKKIARIMAPFFCIGYFFGYPAYSYMTGNFVYWSNGVMILMFIIYTVLLIEKHKSLRKYSIILFLLGMYGNLCCNKLYVIINTAAILCVIISTILQKQNKIINKKRVLVGIIVMFVLASVTAMIGLGFWEEKVKAVINMMSSAGGIYASLYADIIFFLPALFYVFYYTIIKKQYSKTVCIISVCMVCITIIMYILWYNRLMSTYYYYKIYYNLWLCGCLLVIVSLDIMLDKGKAIAFFSYLSMIALIGWITLSDYDARMLELNEDYNGTYATTQMFPLYRYNMDSLLTDYKKYRVSDLTMDVFNIAMEQYADIDVRIVTNNWDLQIWHDSLDWFHPKGCNFNEYELCDLLAFLDENKVQAIIVLKSDEKYELYKEYFDICETVYENADAAILRAPGEQWLTVPDKIKDNSEKKIELFSVVAEWEYFYEGEKVPLIAEQNSYYDYMMYYNITGRDSSKFYPWNLTLLDNIENMNYNFVKHIVLLYDDPYYQSTRYYYDKQVIEYENEAGKIIRCLGDEWSKIGVKDEEKIQ